MRIRLLALVTALIALSLRPAPARADHRPTLATDAFYIGTSIDPGFALLGGWDLDVYVTRFRGISVGPGVSVSVLGAGSQIPGGQQDVLLSVDLLRLKVGIASPNASYRPYVAIGGGFSYARLPAQAVQNVSVSLANGMTASGAEEFPALEEFAPMLTFGGGFDLFTDGPVAATTGLLAHFHPIGSSRIPDVWFEIAVGIRFGL